MSAAFTKASTEPAAVVHTDGLQSYRGLSKLGYEHRRRAQAGAEPGEQLLPRAHRAISNRKAWLHGTHRWASPEHLPAYLDEYVFRHNRRGNPHAAFQTLLGLSARDKPATYRPDHRSGRVGSQMIRPNHPWRTLASAASSTSDVAPR